MVSPPVRGTDDPIDLDGQSSNGDESLVRTRVIETFPVEVENTIFNNTSTRYEVDWGGAGPGGLTTHINEGPGVGTKWVWSTLEAVYTIQSPANFAAQATVVVPPLGLPVFGLSSGGLHAPPTPSGGGSFVVTGKSQDETNITTSAIDLLSSLITFFSPPQLIASCGGSADNGVYETTFSAEKETMFSADTEGDCCDSPGMLLCDDGNCYDYQSDTENCGACGKTCKEGEFCYLGRCKKNCPGSTLACGETCIDPDEDPMNCGACGNACADDEICDAGVCAICPEGLTACGAVCLDLSSDPFNCGLCDNVCQCPGGIGTASCSEGQCVIDPANADCTVESATRALVDSNVWEGLEPLDAGTARLDRNRFSRGRLSRRSALQVPDGLTGSDASPIQRNGDSDDPVDPVIEARVCRARAIGAMTLPPGQSFKRCEKGAVVGRQVFRTATFVVDGQTYQGPCPVIVPAPEVSIPPFYPQPASFLIDDSSGDGLIQPGEYVCLETAVQNLGLGDFVLPIGVLTSDEDEKNPLPITIHTDTSAFESFPAFSGGGSCEAPVEPVSNTNLQQYCFTLPEAHEEDVGRWYNIGFYEQSNPSHVVDMPFVLGVARTCRPEDQEPGAYNVVDGLKSPFGAKLLPEDSPTCNFAASPFGTNSTVPIKLSLGCGSNTLGPDDYETTPLLKYLRRLDDGSEIPLDLFDGDDGANPIDPALACKPNLCEFEGRVNLLTEGSYELGIEMPDGRTFKACFMVDG